MKFKGRGGMKHTKIEIIPMIDTMFFLLVFFILTSLGLVKVTGIDMNLPKGAPAKADPNEKKPIELTIALKQSGEVYVNKTLVGPNEDIGDVMLKEAGKDGTNASVTISAEGLVKHGAVVRVLDEARLKNFLKFAIAPPTSAPPGPGAGGENIPTSVQP